MAGSHPIQLRLPSIQDVRWLGKDRFRPSFRLLQVMNPPMPVAMSIAGSDCSAGAGIQADLKTFQHFHVHGLTAVTCVVSETANTVRAVHPVPVEVLVDQIGLLLATFPVAALKTGMLFSAAHVRAVAGILAGRSDLCLVVDPVMIASTGDLLLELDAMQAYQDLLLPMARVMTPNLHEAEALLGTRIVSEGDLEQAARRLAERYRTAVLLKGGHLEGPDCVDLLVDGPEMHRFSARRLTVVGSHGTGCTLSAAVTALLASGHPLERAVEIAKSYLGETLARSYSFDCPCGGSVHALNQGMFMEK